MPAVVFDVGRVLVHWAPQVIEDALGGLCAAGPDELHAAQARLRHAMSIGTVPAGEYHRYLVETVGMTSSWEEFYEAYCRGLCRDEEALAYADQLKRRGIAVGVISNTNDVHTLWLRQHIPEFRGFDSVIYSSDVGLMKPDPAIYALSLRQLRVVPRQALFVDDLPENVAGAQASGMDALLHREWSTTIVAIEAWLEQQRGQSGYHND